MEDDDDSIFVTILLTILGPNDPPMFSMAAFNFTITENPANDIVVGSLPFTDEGKITCKVQSRRFVYMHCVISGVFVLIDYMAMHLKISQTLQHDYNHL